MPSWKEVVKEVSSVKSPYDEIRHRYLEKMHQQTGRNIISYYSGWLQKNDSIHANNTSINDSDKNGLMNAIHGLDRSLGLDLLLHTPGGSVAATESLVDYLHKMFDGDIRCFIPQLAMSGGTMIACACKIIFMGKQSSIGPIDPQFNGLPAHGVLAEFQQAIEEIKKEPASIPLWQQIISRYHPTFIGDCQHAIDLADSMVQQWLVKYMFKDDSDAEKKAKKIVKKLNNHSDTKMHARHIPAEEALSMGLKIEMLEDYAELQDTVLTIHHTYMHTFSQCKALKIIENHMGNSLISQTS